MSSKLRATRSLAGINSQIVGHPSPNKHYHTIGNTMSPHVGSNSGGSNVGNVKSASVKNKRSASSNSHSQKPASQRGNSNTNIKTSNVVKQNSWTNFSKNWSKKLTQSSSL